MNELLEGEPPGSVEDGGDNDRAAVKVVPIGVSLCMRPDDSLPGYSLRYLSSKDRISATCSSRASTYLYIGNIVRKKWALSTGHLPWV